MSTLTRRQRRILRRAARQGRPIAPTALRFAPLIKYLIWRHSVALQTFSIPFADPWKPDIPTTAQAIAQLDAAMGNFIHAMTTTPPPHRQILHNGRKPR